jgi:hypothetical protein
MVCRMTSSIDMAYTSGEVRQGGTRALAAGQTAAGAAGVLRGVTCPAASLGVVAGAEALAAALARARDSHVALGERVHADHVDLDTRAGTVAGDGDGLTTTTDAVARTAAPSRPVAP